LLEEENEKIRTERIEICNKYEKLLSDFNDQNEKLKQHMKTFETNLQLERLAAHESLKNTQETLEQETISYQQHLSALTNRLEICDKENGILKLELQNTKDEKAGIFTKMQASEIEYTNLKASCEQRIKILMQEQNVEKEKYEAKIDAEREKSRKMHKDVAIEHNTKVQNYIDRQFDLQTQHEKIMRDKDDECNKLKILCNELREKIPSEVEKEKNKKEDVLAPNRDEQPTTCLDLTSPIDVPTLISLPSSPVTPVTSCTTPTETKKRKKAIQQ